MSTYQPKVGDYIFTPEKLAEHDAKVRRAMVERIREKLTAGVVHLMWEDTTDPAGRIGGHAVHLSDLDAILDEEANRE